MAKQGKELLVSREELERVIDSIAELEPYRGFLKGRWVKMVLWWHGRSMEARRKYFLLRAIVVAGGVLIPVLSAFSMRPGWGPVSTIAIAMVGAVVAGCAAWEGVTNYGEVWREKRRAAELLKVEGWMFLQRCGKYQADGSYAQAFPRFAAEVESMISREVGDYLGAFDQSLAQARQTAARLLDDFIQDLGKRAGYSATTQGPGTPEKGKA